MSQRPPERNPSQPPAEAGIRELIKQMDEMILRELSAIQKIALAGEAGEVDAGTAFNEIAQRLGYLARSIPDLSRAAKAPGSKT